MEVLNLKVTDNEKLHTRTKRGSAATNLLSASPTSNTKFIYYSFQYIPKKRYIMLFKKSQVTLFIILGLILVLTLGIFLYIAKTGTETPFETVSQTTITDKHSLKVYVEECIKQVSLDPIVLIGKHGGLITSITYKKFEGTTINYLCTEKNNIPCINSLLLKQDMEKELSRELKNNIDYCLNFEALERQGFRITKGEKQTNTIITNKKIIFTLNYPLTLSKDNTELTINTFTREIENPLGELYLLVTDIINSETSTNQFNNVEFIKQNPGILIQKHKPYPDIIYTLEKDEYIFQFALEGTDTVSTLTQFAYTIDQEGCCYINNTCYSNTLKAHCDLRQGYYESWPCECSNNHKQTTQNTESLEDYKSCDNKQHGESWCEYDSIVGRSYDYVGTRHYLHYCIDGEEYIEPCRDYREELCTEKLNPDLTTEATCRVNRWQDCSKCTTEECCEDTTLRDCYWRDWIDTEKKCSPFVPPGFKFWDYNGMEVCNFVNEEKYCEGFSCPNKWIDDSAVFCYSQGDCGNYRNVNDKLTKYGYFNSDFSDKPRDYVYLEKGNTKKGDEFVVALPLTTTEQAQLSSTTFVESKENLIQLISAVYEYIDSISYVSVSDFLNPFTPKPELEILDISICSVWQAPRGGKHCDLCTEDQEKPCTEYKCKSLGQECIYEEPEGIPNCYKKPEEDSEPISIQINTELLSENYQINSKILSIDKKQINGYEITPAIIPHKPFTFGIKTNKETICTIHYTPRIEYINLPLFFLGEPIYSTEHNVTLRMPPRLSFPQKVMDVMNITTITEFAEILEKPRELIDTYKERFSTIFAAYKLVTGTDPEELSEPFVDDALYFISLTGDLLPFYKELAITIIERFEQGGYILFIQCTDRSGNTNEEDIFIEFEIDEKTADTFPPEIISTSPQKKIPS